MQLLLLLSCAYLLCLSALGNPSIQTGGRPGIVQPASTTLLASEHHPGTGNVTRRHQPLICNCVGMFASCLSL